jgi:Tfp pilus assembly protein PilE
MVAFHIRRRTRTGFTLVEAMITTMIVFIGMLAIISLVQWCQISNGMEQERARAHQIVSQEMEQVRLQLYTRVTAGTTVTVWDNGTPDDPDDDTIGELEVRMRDPDTGYWLSSPPSPAKRVEVEVALTWSPRGRISGKTLRESAMSYISP